MRLRPERISSDSGRQDEVEAGGAGTSSVNETACGASWAPPRSCLRRHQQKVTKLFPKAVRLAGIARPLKLHNLRDTFIVMALNAGVPLAVVSQIVGHSDIRITIRSYGRFGSTELEAAAKRLSRALFTTNIITKIGSG
jgi:hypothetical protein